LEIAGTSIAILTAILFLAPIFSFLVLIFFNEIKSPNLAWVSVAMQFLGLASSIYMFSLQWSNEPYMLEYEWFALAENISIFTGIWIDSHTVLMLVVVNLVALLVNIYSLGYMKGEKNYNRYFAYLSLFIFAMNGLVLADNLLLLFIFWELVGFASYLLIGFWFDKESAAKANKKAFILNRIADLGLLAGILIFWSEYDTLNIHQLKYVVFHFHESFLLLHLAGFGLFLGCMGKSAQFPFQLWLPDAMEGPTPVSALIHAATMVAAGVYLMVKMAFLLTPDVLQTIAIIGSITALIGAFFAISQTDLKRVLAFSTVSQLGFMMAGLGSGGTEAAFFHLITHAFFKACLFLCAGSVIHAMKHAICELKIKGENKFLDPQDMRNMGGLWNQMPITFIAYTVSGLALAGVPFFSGFLSKDAILVAAYSNAFNSENPIGFIVFALLVATSFLTSYYVFKQLFAVFGSKLRIEPLLQPYNIRIHESKLAITIPLIILSFLCIGFVFSTHPFDFDNAWLMRQLVQNHEIYSQQHGVIAVISIDAIIIGLVAFIVRKWYYKKDYSNSLLRKYSFNQLYMNELSHLVFIKPSIFLSTTIASFDTFIIDKSVNLLGASQVIFAHIVTWIDRTFIDGIVNGTGFLANTIGKLFSKTQNGQIQTYILYTIFIVVSILLFLMIAF